jgi:hypothetical protein
MSLLALLVSFTLSSCRNSAEKEASAVAQASLSVIDAGDYAKSWNTGAAYLQRAAAEKQWEASMDGMRKPLGRVLSREIKSAKTSTTAVGDRCVVVEFDTAFENKSAAVETVTLLPEKDGQWRVAGYFIQ